MSGFGRGRGDDASNWRRGSSYEPSNASSSSASSRRGPPRDLSSGSLPLHQEGPPQPPVQRGLPAERSRWFPSPVNTSLPTRPPMGNFGRGEGPSRGFGGPPREPREPEARSPVSPFFRAGQQRLPPAPDQACYASDQPAVVDARLDDQSQNALIGAFNRLRVRGKFPNRPGWGTSGKPVTMRANHFAITYSTARIYDYTVKIEPKPNIRRIRKRIFQLLEQAPEFASFKPHTVHDSGGRIISSKVLPIPLTGQEINVRYYDEDEEAPHPHSITYVVTITFNSQLDIDTFNK